MRSAGAPASRGDAWRVARRGTLRLADISRSRLDVHDGSALGSPRMNPPLLHAPHRPGFPRAARWLVLALLLLVGVAAAVSCGPSPIERARARLLEPLAALADSGDVEALRVVADIEVLRASGMLSDSVANVLTAMPG